LLQLIDIVQINIYKKYLSTGQKFNGVEESLGIEMKVKDEVTQEIKATTKNACR
jgi:hypothetical protein